MSCKKCDEPAVPGRVLCERHGQIAREYQARWQAKKAGGDVPALQPRQVVKKPMPAAPVLGIAVARIVPAVDFAAAIQQIRDELDVLEQAQAILGRRRTAC